ncbi:MAG: TatD family hydrolase, partial [Candidatus Paceibacterota bacterium]
TSAEVVELAHKYESMFATVGQHPSPHGVADEFDYDFYKKLASDPKVVAIGECGLDYFHAERLAFQKGIFEKQIDLAIEFGKPLMLHVRNGKSESAYLEALEILKAKSALKADFHFFAGSWEEAKAILAAGFYISFDGPITFARNYDEVIKNAPLDRIMSETDAPFATPAPYRGKRNEPLYVVEVVKKIAEIRGEDFEKVRAQLVQNTKTFFSLSQ